MSAQPAFAQVLINDTNIAEYIPDLPEEYFRLLLSLLWDVRGFVHEGL